MIDAAEVRRSRTRDRLSAGGDPPTGWATERVVVRLPFVDPEGGWTRSTPGSSTILRGPRERRHGLLLLTVRAALVAGRTVLVLTGGHGADGWEHDLRRIVAIPLDLGDGWALQVLDAAVTPDRLEEAVEGCDLVVIDGADRLAPAVADVFAGPAFRPVDPLDAVATWARRTGTVLLAAVDVDSPVPGPERSFYGDHLVDLTDDPAELELLVAPDGHPVRRFAHRHPGHWLRVDAPSRTPDPEGTS